MTERFKNRVVLITGGASGIGAASAVAFAREGASVVIADRDRGAAETVLEAMHALGCPASFVQADVSDPIDSEQMVAETVEEYGSLDIAINNAGVLQEAMPLAEITVEAFDRIVATNLRGVFLGMKYEIQQMLRQGQGVIVNMTSFGGLIGFPGFGAYTASKHGIVGLTRAAALDYAAQGIRINAIAPGIVRTPMLDRVPAEHHDSILAMEPIGRLAEPEEVARSILYLASDDSSFMVGHIMAVDGGLTIK